MDCVSGAARTDHRGRGRVLIGPLSFGVVIMSGAARASWPGPAHQYRLPMTVFLGVVRHPGSAPCCCLLSTWLHALCGSGRPRASRTRIVSGWRGLPRETQLFCVCWAGACALTLLAPDWAFELSGLGEEPGGRGRRGQRMGLRARKLPMATRRRKIGRGVTGSFPTIEEVCDESWRPQSFWLPSRSASPR